MIITIRSAVHIVAIIIVTVIIVLMIYQDLVCAGLSNPLPTALLIVWPPLIIYRCFWLLLTTMMFLLTRMMLAVILYLYSDCR